MEAGDSNTASANPVLGVYTGGEQTSIEPMRKFKVHSRTVTFEHLIDYDGMTLIERVDLTTQTDMSNGQLRKKITSRTRTIGRKCIRETTVEHAINSTTKKTVTTVMEEEEIEQFNYDWKMLWKPSIANDQVGHDSLDRLHQRTLEFTSKEAAKEVSKLGGIIKEEEFEDAVIEDPAAPQPKSLSVPRRPNTKSQTSLTKEINPKARHTLSVPSRENKLNIRKSKRVPLNKAMKIVPQPPAMPAAKSKAQGTGRVDTASYPEQSIALHNPAPKLPLASLARPDTRAKLDEQPAPPAEGDTAKQNPGVAAAVMGSSPAPTQPDIPIAARRVFKKSNKTLEHQNVK